MQHDALTPHLAHRLAFLVVTVFFTAGLAWNLNRWLRGTLEWTTTVKIALPIVALFCLAGILGTLLIWTSKVWVDPTTNTLHQRWLWQHNVRALESPTQVRFHYTPAATGSTLTGQWKADVIRPGDSDVRIATPYVPNFSEFARLLQPALQAHPEVAADEFTRRSIQEPESMTSPQP